VAQSIQKGGIFMEQQGADDLLLVEAYGNGGFRLRGRRVEGSVILIGDGFFPLDATSVSDLKGAHFDHLLNAEEKPEILFIGTGSQMHLLPADVRKYLENSGYMPEVMDTGAAARTLNVLRMENRRVAALLIQVD